MREGFDKEIDTLLRRRARGTPKSFANGDGAAAHLDADELAAFAEGALPSAARVAAASHLADCNECRGIVVTLTRSLGVGAESKKEAVGAASSTVPAKQAAWRAWAASLFSPRVLRFAAPVLALSVVAVVSFVALRSRQGGALQVARNETPRAEAPKEQPGAADPATTETGGANPGSPAEVRPGGAPHDPNAAGALGAGRGLGAGDAPVAAGVAATGAPPPPPQPAASPEGPAEVASAPARPAVEEPAPAKSDDRDGEKTARAPEAAEEVAVSDLSLQQRRAAQSRANEVQMPDGSRNQRRAADNNAGNFGVSGGGGAPAAPGEAKRDAQPAPAARRGRSATRTERRLDEDEEARTAETRSAAGRRFRREGSAWVDVNYRPSMPSTGVRRGTEAFRALVADFPEIGSVAEQLPGEVIVVVRGRAYRIR